MVNRSYTGEDKKGILMEINLGILVLCAFLGLVIRAFMRLDPWKLLGSLSLVILLLPALLIVVQNDPEVMKAMSDRYIERVTAEFPSMIIGELAGVFAAQIFKVLKGIFDAISNLFR